MLTKEAAESLLDSTARYKFWEGEAPPEPAFTGNEESI